MDTVGEGKSGMNRESSLGIYILLCIKEIAGEKLLYNTESPTCDDLGGRLRGGKEGSRGRGYMYKYD